MFTMNYQYRVYPNLEQQTRMVSWLEMCRGVYNYALRERKDWIQSRKCDINACSLLAEYIVGADAPYPGYYEQQNALTAIKAVLPHLKDVQSQVVQEPIRRVEAAFAAMKQRGHGFPRFKKFGQYRSFLFPQFKSSPIEGSKIKLPKLGVMSIVLHRPIPNGFVVKTVRVTHKHSGWYCTLCLQIDVDIPDVVPYGKAMGIDVGLGYFLSTSEGEQIERPRFFGKFHRKLKLLQRCLKRKQKRSKTRSKLIEKIGRVFVNQLLPWVCIKRGVYYGKVDPNGTSQTCPDCGARVRKDLSVRIHECHECGSLKPRDVAAGQVIKARGLSGVEIASGAEVSGALETVCRQLAMKLESLKSDLEKPALYT